MQKPKFRIGTSTDTAYELKKAIELQLLYVSSLYDPLQKEAGKVIHETRQSCKKCRALLRLMRDTMGYASYFRENRNLRTMQRELSRVRDAEVQYLLFSKLSKSYPEYTRYDWFNGLMEKIRTTYDLQLDHFLNGDITVQIARIARSTAAQIQTYELIGQGFGIIEAGLSRIYRQGREMGIVVFSENADAHIIHELRKKAKYLQYQLFFLRGIFQVLFTAMSRTMEELTDKLGHFNDLHLGCERIVKYAEQFDVKQKDYEGILNRLREEMQKVKSDSHLIYVNAYSEPTGAFIRRIRRYWDSYYYNL